MNAMHEVVAGLQLLLYWIIALLGHIFQIEDRDDTPLEMPGF